MPKTATPTPLETATATSAESLAAMESEAAEFFANQEAARTQRALNPVAPALEAAAEEAPVKKSAPKVAEKATATPKTATSEAKSTGKVPGAPALKALQAAEKTAEGAKTATDGGKPDTNAPDFSDIPREYVPGGIRGVNWNKLHAKADHYEALSTQRNQEIENLRAELEAARASSASAAPSAEVTQRLTTLQQERDVLQARLEAVAVEKSPRFEAQFKPRRDAALAQAKAAVGPAEAAKIEQLLNMGESSYRDEQVEALLSSLPPLRATKLTQAVADLDRLAAERASMAAQGSELWKQWVNEEKDARDRQTAERTARATSTFDAELKEWEVAGVTPEEAQAARSVYTGKDATLQDASRAALWGAVGPRVAKQLMDAQSRITELEGQLSKLRGAQPGVGAAGAGAAPATNGDEEDDPRSTSYAERIARQAMRQGLRFGT